MSRARSSTDAIDPEAEVQQRAQNGREPSHADPSDRGRHVALAQERVNRDEACGGDVRDQA